MIEAGTDTSALEDALGSLRTAVVAPSFDLSADGGRSARALRDRIGDDIAGHQARLRDLEAPLLAVFGGVTGAGKSSVVNTLVGSDIVATGVLRPTTFAPTLVCHPADASWFTGDRILPGLPRREGAPSGRSRGDAGELHLVHSERLPRGLALVDAPDIDSVAEANRDLADTLLDAADLWLWFVSAGKYADEESMRYLRRGGRRRTALAIVLTQVRLSDRDEIVADFGTKLAAEGLRTTTIAGTPPASADQGDVQLFVVGYVTPEAGQLPADAITHLRAWLLELADPALRIRARLQTLDGALDDLPSELKDLSDAIADELRTARTLTADAERAYADARREFAAALEEGLPLRQEVLARWNRFVGTGRFMRLAEQAAGQARGWMRTLLTGVTTAEEEHLEREVRVEVADTVGDLSVRLCDLAAAETSDSWARDPAGRALVAAHPELARSSPGLRGQTEAAVRAWQETVVELVQTRGAERKVRARWMSTVINAAATGAIVLALAHTGGLTGAEAGIATAAGAANQTLLVKLLGAANLRWLVGQAKESLTGHFEDLATGERRRFTAVVADAAPDPALSDDIDDALAGLHQARA